MARNRGNRVKIGQKSTKIAPRTAEKRLKRFAPPTRHDEAQFQHAFDHRRPWYRQQSAILATYGAARDGVLWAGKRLFFLIAVGRIGGIAANPLSACGGQHGLFLTLCHYPAPLTVWADSNACRAPL